MEFEKSRLEFAKIQKRISAINHAIDLMHFDAETAAPAESSANRIFTLGILSDELFELKFGEKTHEITESLLENESELNLVEKRSLVVLKRESDRMKSVPKDEYIEYQGARIAALDAWHRANEESDYEVLRPHLEKIFGIFRDFASIQGVDPFEFCLNIYEPGSSRKVYDTIFDNVKKVTVPLLHRIAEKPPIDDSCLKGDFSVAKQEELAKYVMKLLGVDLTRVGLGTSEHPFTKRIGSHLDERITTKYSRKDFTFSLYTILFGCGYALADMGQDDAVVYTLADGSASLGIMEAQTRFYEHLIGRSLPFIELLYPELKSLFPNSLREATPEDLYMAVNKVSADPIRIGSDEVTNNLHILVRYEMERALMDKDLSFKDLPDAWAEKYKEYLGVEVKNHNQGVLQDILWADAAIGYFPTGILGNTYSAIILEKMKNDLDVYACVREGNFEAINQWNREHIWKQIGLHDSHTLMEEFLGADSINGDTYVNYLNDKYSIIYNL